jgi:TRAP-type C4-dicarboxylate transport system permease small subunit
MTPGTIDPSPPPTRAVVPPWLRRADDAVYAVERIAVVVSVAAMIVMVFLDVVDRRLEAPESKLAALLGALLRPLHLSGSALGALAPAVGFVTLAGLVWFALATMRRRGASSLPRRLEPVVAAVAAGGLFALGWLMLHRPSNEVYALLWLGGGIAVGVRQARARDPARRLIAVAVLLPAGTALLHRFVPEGYSWAKEVAMILLVWTGFIGASMAAHDGRHIDIDFGNKMFPAPLRAPLAALARVLNIGFCAFIVLVGIIYVFGPSGLYRLEGRFPHTGIPDWTVALSIPISFSLIALRTSIVVLKVVRGDVTKGSFIAAPEAPESAP